MASAENVTRYHALDSWRGICACMVALFHFDVISHLSFLPLTRHAYLFVDFFFVLSGFVIASNYRSRLAEGFGTGRFLVLRLGRIYPLHLVTLLLFIPIDAAKDGIRPNLLQAIVTNVLLLQGLGINPQNWLNFASWSISTEFAAYAIFAVVVSRIGPAILPWLLPIMVGPAVLATISPDGMNATYDYGLVRCLYGFALGVVCFDLRERFPVLRARLGPSGETWLEAASVMLVVFYVSVAGSNVILQVASPMVFTLVVLVFAREAGAVSRRLTAPSMLMIGTLTYSIYMLHPLVRAVVRAILMVVERLGHMELFVSYALSSGHEPTKVVSLNGSLWLGDLLQIAMLLSTVLLSVATYRFVEEPGRNWVRRLTDRRKAAAVRSAQPAFET
ncbi:MULTISPECIES: acyltransferase family protein [Bradyrhizobium]|uniref:Acyltransferase n=1 Tax=Bradyrhizobium vignae TaxID=1549949 RepID=A0A2U3QC18_9BRAD|nr:acyltransferase [Bradyrhizobium vignae]MBP0113065.1 acyltransferase [Bradyrhizobium vignae]SPP98937.1 Acyltransferase [Bradyrhizobium vignae]